MPIHLYKLLLHVSMDINVVWLCGLLTIDSCDKSVWSFTTFERFVSLRIYARVMRLVDHWNDLFPREMTPVQCR